MNGVTALPGSSTGTVVAAKPGGTADNLQPREDASAAPGQSAIVVAVLVGFLVIPLGLGLFEWRMQEVTYAALQTAAREAARDGAGAFAVSSLTAGTPQLDPQQVAMAVQESLSTNLGATLPEVTTSDADAAARAAATGGLTITGLTVCVIVAVPVHFIIQPARTWTYSARGCAHSIVPAGEP